MILADECLRRAGGSFASVLRDCGCDAQADVHLLTAPRMAELNAAQRERPEVTDVLSFPLLAMADGVLTETPSVPDFIEEDGERRLHIGEIVLCTDRLREQAAAYGHSPLREGAFLFVHGLLHLLGYDHEAGKKEELRMTSLQNEILNALGLDRSVTTWPDALAAVRDEEEDGEAGTVEVFSGEGFRAGFTAIVGRPNIGKSTLLNFLMDYPLAITSRKAQTTRRDIRGVLNRPSSQIILIDTPGVAKGTDRLEEAMSRTWTAALQDADLLLFMVDARFKEAGKPELRLLERMREEDVPAILLINKIDLIPKEELLPLIANYASLYPFREIIPVSLLQEDGTAGLPELIERHLPLHPPYYGEDAFTDQSEKLLAAERIRKLILENYHDELPYAMTVKVEYFFEEWTENGERGRCEVLATVYCETESQKRILYGRDFRALKRLRSRSRRSLAELLDCPVDLDLHVKVRKDWRRKPGALRDLGLESGSTDGLAPLQ